MAELDSFCFRGAGLDRAAALRRDCAALLGEARARVLPIRGGMPLMRETGAPDGRRAMSLCWLAPADPVLAEGVGTPFFLGIAANGHACFAQPMPAAGADDAPPFPDLPGTPLYTDLRARMTALTPAEGELAVVARALALWHETHGFCAHCGASSAVAMGGWQRDCPACGASHYPRTDPVVIMLVTSGNRVLLGRSAGWPEGMYSLLAGFVEPAEPPEAAVRREVFEEAGVRVGAVRYLASQPWPFPASLMMACAAEAESEAITLDPAELEDALWLSREELAAVLRGERPGMFAARRGAIARTVLEHWLADRLDAMGDDGGVRDGQSG